ncbi:MAG: hypothetical protein HUJ61_07050 [Bacilli bacterium]|nr:hypothetical protein [Bacilli bacterium]
MVLHQYGFEIGEGKRVQINHVLFGNKFLYCIYDRVYNGGLSGHLNDEMWLNYHKNGNKYEKVKNPLKANRVRTDKFQLLTQIDPEDIISLVVINDDCILNSEAIERDDHNMIVHLSDLERTIVICEGRNVAPFDENQLTQVINELNVNNVNNKSYKKQS